MRRIRYLFIVGLLALAASGAGCGGSGSEGLGPPGVVDDPRNGTSPPAVGPRPMGTITVAFSDAPASEEFVQALMVIREIRLVALDPDEQDVVWSDAPLTIDLLQLTGFSEILLQLQVPIDAEYYALEFWAESLTLVRPDGSMEVAALGENGYTPVPVGAAIPATLRDYSGTGTIPSFRVPDFNSVGRLFVNVEVPLDLALHRAPGGRYHLSPLAFLTLPHDGLFRIAGNVAEIVEPNVKHPQGAFRVCDLQKASAPGWVPQGDGACAVVAPYPGMKFLSDSVNLTFGEIGELILGDPVVVYGWWGIYVEQVGIDPIHAMLVARGTGFERAHGPISLLQSQDTAFTLGGAVGDCPSAFSAQHVALGSDALIFRKKGERTVPVERDQIVTCARAEVEGVRTAADELSAMVVILRPQQFNGVLTFAGTGSPERFTLSHQGAEPTCVVVSEETEVTEFYYQSMGTYYGDAAIESLVGRTVAVSGLQGLDGCIAAERVAFVE